MHVKKNLMLWIAALVLAIPLMFIAGNAAAYVGDGARVVNGAFDALSVPNPPTNVCYACHNGADGPTIDKSSYVKTGHKNMLRKVTAGQVWKGPDGVTYTKGAGGPGGHGANGTFDWSLGTFSSVGGGGATAGTYPMYYIWGDWIGDDTASMGVLHGPDVLYVDPAGKNGYCGAYCHSTGFKLDAGQTVAGAYRATKNILDKPLSDFPNLANGGTNAGVCADYSYLSTAAEANAACTGAGAPNACCTCAGTGSTPYICNDAGK